ncbi:MULTISPECIES: penicillin-binding protein 1C [unclassified Undibacterium]|uniref:penicillin-binding protein 1C n=1 Tax=unclassified Undibacterium TaxID=2630295 RepID=UPI002AC95E15|nr:MULTISPECIES: penicillin-binding protein 1C [unclassified Undibacterium]MEB0140236.1 penicillin-binding protein 1C [Undibacterium sp. CCC2.1]MEB0173267.1 penicillin-binding protein 1C [Undibacterium sp. CCC1.1]MEB0177110.1 penicillin-binding protein 1C [Undibacterium sp. CCC3.4]MEB0216375.1 penicillin-binding protein 1C [Undibacterium sp. 5I2]WPX42986.1 penicillin-binding protein 1C [Undibacterium sp. CCC3.4]
MARSYWCHRACYPLLLWLFCGSAAALPGLAQLKAEFASSEGELLDRHGVVIQQLRVNMNERKLPWVKLDEISPALRLALISSEDKQFYQHSGIDWRAVAGAAWGNVWNSKTRGASTITMQLAGLLDEKLRRRAGGRSTVQKINQAWVAQSLERNWRKDEILEAYLNLVAFRGELVGVHALSRILFDKHPSGLDQVESALAVALLRAPNASVANVSTRACRILQEQGQGSMCLNLQGQATLAFARLTGPGLSNSLPPALNLAPHLARRLLSERRRRVQSTLDARLQAFAADSLRRQLAALVQRNVEDGAVLVLDNASGEVLAWVGSSGSLSDAPQVDAVTALRQAGSTLKPFLYELALERRLLTAASLLDDQALNLSTTNGLYIPQNYDKHYQGLISVRTALAASLNIPAVRTLVSVQPQVFFERLQALGFGLRESGDFYGYSLALGSADVSLAALTNAYRSLANQGRYSALREELATRVAPVVQRMNPAASFIVADILSDRAARAHTFGLENALTTRVWSAVKTGTSKDMRDNWCIGFSGRYTVGVWVGNASGAPMWDVSGQTGAAPVWQEIIHYLHRGAAAPAAPRRPAGVEQRAISYADSSEAPRSEYFLIGTGQDRLLTAASDQIRAAINYPKAGMVVALDPDIPAQRQRMRLRAQSLQPGILLIDGKPIKSTANIKQQAAGILEADWFPWPGRHTVSLRDRSGKLLDEIQFEVRGAVEKKPA